MPKKKVAKKVNKKVSSQEKKSQSVPSWIWWALGVLVLLAVLFFVYDGVTGNAVDTKNSFKPIVDMVSGLVSNVYQAIEPVLVYVVGDTTSVSDIDSSGIFFAKVLLLILVFSVVFSVLKSTNISFFRGATLWVVSSAVSILSIRFLASDFVEMIIIPYSTLGVALTAIIPLVIYFFFVENGLQSPYPRSLRRAAWIFFGVIFLLIWVLRADSLPEDSLGASIYPMTALIAFFMCFIDGTIQNLFSNMKFQKQKYAMDAKHNALYMDMNNDVEIRWKKALDANPDGSTYSSPYQGSEGWKGGSHKTGYQAYVADIRYIHDQMQISAGIKKQ